MKLARKCVMTRLRLIYIPAHFSINPIVISTQVLMTSSNDFQPFLIVIAGVCIFLLLSGMVSADDVFIVDFSANRTSGLSPLTVLFSDISTVPGSVYDRTWSLGDGSVVSSGSATIVHTYTNAGIYTVQMDRTDDEGYHSRIKYNYIIVTSPTPTPTPTVTTITTSPTDTPTTTFSPTSSPTATATTAVPTTVAPSILPAQFYGSALVQGAQVTAGSTIQARIGDRIAGSITLSSPGVFGGSGPFDTRLGVYATEEEAGSGSAVISFWLNGVTKAYQTVPFQSGSVQSMDLTFPATPPTTSTTVPTTAPTTSPTTFSTTPTPTRTTTGRPTSTTAPPTTSPTTTPITTSTTAPTSTPTTNVTTSPTTQGPTSTITGRPTTVTFTPTPTIVPDMNIPLFAGWNFISIPRRLAPGSDTGSIFSGVDTGGRSVFYYNSSSGLWERITTSYPLRPLIGIWIYSESGTVVPLTFQSQQGPVQASLAAGWNAFGIPNLTAVPARDALGPLHRKWDRVIGFDSEIQQYENTIVLDGTGSHSDTIPLQPAKGYWVSMTGSEIYRADIPSV